MSDVNENEGDIVSPLLLPKKNTLSGDDTDLTGDKPCDGLTVSSGNIAGRTTGYAKSSPSQLYRVIDASEYDASRGDLQVGYCISPPPIYLRPVPTPAGLDEIVRQARWEFERRTADVRNYDPRVFEEEVRRACEDAMLALGVAETKLQQAEAERDGMKLRYDTALKEIDHRMKLQGEAEHARLQAEAYRVKSEADHAADKERLDWLDQRRYGVLWCTDSSQSIRASIDEARKK